MTSKQLTPCPVLIAGARFDWSEQTKPLCKFCISYDLPILNFRDVVLVLPCSSTNKGKKNLCGCAEKVNRQWAFVAVIVIVCRACNLKTVDAFAQIDWHPKNGALFSLIYFFGSFYVYYIPHNYVIPQAMFGTCHSANSFRLLPPPIKNS